MILIEVAFKWIENIEKHLVCQEDLVTCAPANHPNPMLAGEVIVREHLQPGWEDDCFCMVWFHTKHS
jgi:hypothetical protein